MSTIEYEEDYDSIPSTDAQIMSSIQDLMSKKSKDEEEDFATYKARMKDLLEQLLLKLEEDVDYQKNLELQIEDLERDLKAKDYDIERLSRQAKDAIDDCKSQANEMAQEMISKLNLEMERNAQYKSLLIQLQSENFRLKSDLRIQQYADASENSQGATAYMTDLRSEMESLKLQLAQSQAKALAIKRQRDNEMTVVLGVIKSWESRFANLQKLVLKTDISARYCSSSQSPQATNSLRDEFFPPPPPIELEAVGSSITTPKLVVVDDGDDDEDNPVTTVDTSDDLNIYKSSETPGLDSVEKSSVVTEEDPDGGPDTILFHRNNHQTAESSASVRSQELNDQIVVQNDQPVPSPKPRELKIFG